VSCGVEWSSKGTKWGMRQLVSFIATSFLLILTEQWHVSMRSETSPHQKLSKTAHCGSLIACDVGSQPQVP
jgi:hypothetical protein